MEKPVQFQINEYDLVQWAYPFEHFAPCWGITFCSPVPFLRPPRASSMRSAGTGMAIYARDIGFVDGVMRKYRKLVSG